MNQGQFTGGGDNRMMFNVGGQQQQQYGMNRVASPHQGLPQSSVGDDMTGISSSSGNIGNTGHLGGVGGVASGSSGSHIQASAGGTGATQMAPKEPPNTATICRIGQETVQEIVTRIQEVFSYLKTLQPIVGNPAQDRGTLDKQQRLQEVLKGINQLFRRLHLCYERAQEQTSGMEYTQIESLIPLKDDRDVKSELEKKRGEAYKSAMDEHNELVQQLTAKNRHLKEIIDQMRSIIWEINTMLAMREPQ